MLWNKNMETGVAKIDDQHRQLFVQAERLLDKNYQDRIPETLEFLKNYVVRHFTDEEALQAKVSYPKAAAHHNLHIAFTNNFKKLYDAYKEQGDKLSVKLAINSMVVNWLKDHIMTHDKEFFQYYSQHAKRA